jgi:hypothetical protein
MARWRVPTCRTVATARRVIQLSLKRWRLFAVPATLERLSRHLKTSRYIPPEMHVNTLDRGGPAFHVDDKGYTITISSGLKSPPALPIKAPTSPMTMGSSMRIDHQMNLYHSISLDSAKF